MVERNKIINLCYIRNRKDKITFIKLFYCTIICFFSLSNIIDKRHPTNKIQRFIKYLYMENANI